MLRDMKLGVSALNGEKKNQNVNIKIRLGEREPQTETTASIHSMTQPQISDRFIGTVSG
jgi:hypothetical protein